MTIFQRFKILGLKLVVTNRALLFKNRALLFRKKSHNIFQRGIYLTGWFFIQPVSRLLKEIGKTSIFFLNMSK